VDQDTSPAARTRYHAHLRRLPPAARLEAAVALSGAVRTLVLAGLRARHPEADEAELQARLVVRLYGRSYADRVLKGVPSDAV
jgi:hypothetical protein